MHTFYKLSITFVLGLHHLKLRAEKEHDKTALNSLQQQYPELFSEQFVEFIQNLQSTIEYFYEYKDVDFRKLLDSEYNISTNILQ